MEHGQAEAASRAEAFAFLKAQGIVPLEMRGGKVSPLAGGGQWHRSSLWIGLSLVVVVAVALGVGAWFAMGHKKPPAASTKVASTRTARNQPLKTGRPSNGEPSQPVPHEVKPEIAVSPSQKVPLNSHPKPKGKNPAALLALQSSCKEGLDFTVDTNKIAELRRQNPTWAENKLQAQLTEYAIPGRFCGTPDPISDKEAQELCDMTIVDSASDSDLVKAEKAAVRDLQKQLKDYLAEGGHANDFMMKLMERQDAEHAMMEQVKRQMTELCRSGDYDLAQEALDKYNAYLKEKGLPEIHTNPYMRHLLKVNAAKLQQTQM